MMRKIMVCVLLALLVACSPSDNVTATPVPIVKLLATVEISSTPNPEEFAATRVASSPTPLPPTITVVPTETPYIGQFVGEAQAQDSFTSFTEPLFGLATQSAVATANAGRCTIAIDTPYVAVWQRTTIVNQRLGCPIQGGFGFIGQVQLFERGLMVFYPELTAIWAIQIRQTTANDGRGFFDYLENPPPLSTTGIQAPAGLSVPVEIFGSMWLAVDQLQTEIGYARTASQETPIGLQRFENGIVLLDVASQQIYVLIIDGTVLGPFPAPSDSLPGVQPTLTIAPPATETATTTP